MQSIIDVVRSVIGDALVQGVKLADYTNPDGEQIVRVTIVYNDQVGRPSASAMGQLADQLWQSEVLGGAIPVLVFRSETDSRELEAA